MRQVYFGDRAIEAKGSIFISRAGADADFAAVVGSVLEAAGYSVVLQQWDFANRNFMERMHAALASGARVVALLSPEYLQSEHCQAEWQNAIAGDPLNKAGRLILLRVAECEPGGLLSGLAYWDLVPIRDNPALLEDIVRDAVRETRERTPAGSPYLRAPRTIVDPEAIRPVPSFSGREEELAAIRAALSGPDAIAAVCGLGGVGKSSIAREYAWRNREAYSIVWWLNAQTEDAIVDALLRLGAIFVRGLDQHADRRAAAQQVGSVLRGFAKPVLLIFDNLEDERLLRSWLPRGDAMGLVTSRNATWSAGVTTVPLPAWSLQTASDYLMRESGRADVDAGDAAAIAEALGALPLAMAHAAAALRSMRMIAPKRYLARIGDYLKNAPAAAEYPRSVFATFNAAIAQAEHDAPGAAAVARFAASFTPDAIPDELFRQSGELYPAEFPRDELALDAALGALDHLSLLAFSEVSRTYTMHRLVQMAACDAGEAERRAAELTAVAVAEAAFPDAKYSVAFEDWPKCERLAPHARAALAALPADCATLEAAKLAQRCAVYLRERGDYAVAEALQLRALAMLEGLGGPDHPDVATALNNLGIVYWHSGRYDEVEGLNRRALRILEASFGVDHPDVATTLNNLGLLYNQRGRHAEAEPLHVQALAIREKCLGPEHPNVATSLNNLAIVIAEQGRYAESEPLQVRALSLRERALGPDHPHVANALNNLAANYYEQGRYAEAEPLHRRALDIWERALGPEHSDVAMALHNLANDCHGLTRYDEAERLQRRALAIWESALGTDHEYVAISLRGLADVLDAQGRYEEGESLHLRALAILERSLGGEHGKVATSLRDLARSYRARGKSADAAALYERALAIREASLGADHPATRALREEITGG